MDKKKIIIYTEGAWSSIRDIRVVQPLCVIKKIASKKLVINLIIDFQDLELSLRNVNKLF